MQVIEEEEELYKLVPTTRLITCANCGDHVLMNSCMCECQKSLLNP